MDLLIGGIPRSGTTALALATDALKGVSCWSSETHFVNLTFGILGLLRQCQVRPDSDRLEKYLYKNLVYAMVTLRARNKGLYDVELPNCSRKNVRELAARTTAILLSANHSTDVEVQLLAALTTTMRQVQDSEYFAEKSPDNLLFAREVVSHARVPCILVYRSVSEILQSMRNRFLNDVDGAHFGISQLGLVGTYCRYARHLLAVPELGAYSEAEPPLYRLSYQRINHDPIGVMANISYLLRRDFRILDASAVTQRIGLPSYAASENQVVLTSLELAITKGVRDELEAFQFDVESKATDQYGESWNQWEGIHEFFGFYPRTAANRLVWCESEFEFVVVAGRTKNVALFELFSGLDEKVIGTVDQTIRVYDRGALEPYSGMSPIIEIDIKRGAAINLEVGLQELTPIATREGYTAYRVNFCVTPSAIPTICSASGDERMLSILYGNAMVI